MHAERLRAHGFTSLSTCASKSTLEVARQLGNILKLEGVSEIQTLIPRNAEDVEKNRYSGIYGTQSFPLHSDLAHWHIPPRYFLLRCIDVAESVPTYIVHSKDIFEPEGDLVLKRALFRPRRRQDGRLTCLRLAQDDCYRWDPIFLEAVNKVATELRSRVLLRIEKTPKNSVTFSKPGDCIVVDNWKALHGRAAVPADAMHRRIERVYLNSIQL